MSRWLHIRLVADRLLAAVGLVLTAPVTIVLMVLVKRHDRGPALVAVPRIGRHGATFGMWKVRSMRPEEPDGRARGSQLTAADDARITPIGAAMRARHLDELPQLWNVVRGEMMLVGARPEAPAFVDLADARWASVLVAPPGIAGPAQVVLADWETEQIGNSGSTDAYLEDVLPVKLAIDTWYLRNSSPRLDVQVAAAVIGRVASRSGIGALERRIRAEVAESGRVFDVA